MEKVPVIDAVEKLLSSSPKSARDFLKALKSDGTMSDEGKKKAINSALYTLLKAGKAEKSETTPPFWTKPKTTESKSGSEEEASEESVMSVFIDITSSPCHENAAKYAKATIPIHLFWNPNYPGVIPSASKPVGVTITDCVSSAMLVRMTVAAYRSNNPNDKIVVVSTSSAFNDIERLLKEVNSKIEVEVIKDGWESLKLLLE